MSSRWPSSRFVFPLVPSLGTGPFGASRLRNGLLTLCEQSLDLHQTAYHYLYTSLLKIKSVAEHPDLPPIVRRTIPKPELEEKEQAALHHVTSCLFNRLEVRAVMEKVVAEVCGALGLPPPEKKKTKKKGAKGEEESEPRAAPADRKDAPVDDADAEKVAKKEKKEKKEKSRDEGEKLKKAKAIRNEETETEDEGEDAEGGAPGEELDTDEEERAFAKYESLLAASDDSDADSESESDHIQKGKRRSIRVRDMSISLSPEPESASSSSSPFASADGLDYQSESGSESQSESESQSDSDSGSEPPPKQAKLSKSKSRARSPDQTFLPSLMGGYVSGSESASDVDVAPRKNRLGQKQRQAIWERKFGAQARHVQQEQKQKGRRKGAVRGDGWDLQRGAVDEEPRGRKPWKKGVEGPLAAVKGSGPAAGGERRPTKKDDEGALHPSWEARKRAKEREKQQPRRIDVRPSGGNKIVFDD